MNGFSVCLRLSLTTYPEGQWHSPLTGLQVAPFLHSQVLRQLWPYSPSVHAGKRNNFYVEGMCNSYHVYLLLFKALLIFLRHLTLMKSPPCRVQCSQASTDLDYSWVPSSLQDRDIRRCGGRRAAGHTCTPSYSPARSGLPHTLHTHVWSTLTSHYKCIF